MNCKRQCLVLLFSVNLLLLQNVASFLQAELVVEFAKQKGLQMIVVYSCFVSKRGRMNAIKNTLKCNAQIRPIKPILAQVSFYKYVMSHAGRTVMFNNRMINEAEDLLRKVGSSTAVIADAECSAVRELLLKVIKMVPSTFFNVFADF